ncbi:MAG TPA: Hsp20/alpha crystallin family protein [Stackebrandtia sp.]|jgi:HSP20 family protein|uniref:Hsp20/alpha crystallin family protein n=1 Tax=Stackebrandtia sp. TaxID=2023065 RepID=UPI002D68BFC5|nr:Hsp20/alpha crystallin family protein [Stackebrandtia sp.]HZE38266.1 Hsp20/alpha crystallin family protein [Stackebrandtia sp.]
MLVRYRQPWYRSSLVNAEFDRLVAEAFGQGQGSFSPGADIATQGNDVVITVDIPGVAPEDVDITLDGRRLVITGQRQATQVAEGDRVIARGLRQGKFSRTFTVPQGTAAEQISASVDNGLLTVRVTEVTKPEPQPQKIAVTRVAEAIESGETETETETE